MLTPSAAIATIASMERRRTQDQEALLPTGTLTFVFSDIEGSTRLLQALGRSYDALLETHDRIIRSAAEAEGGRSFGSEGDASRTWHARCASSSWTVVVSRPRSPPCAPLRRWARGCRPR